MKTLKNSLMICLLLLISNLSFGQFFDSWVNPEVTLNLEHPPLLGLKVQKVVFNPTGRCSDQIYSSVVSDFVQNGVEVIDRNNWNKILAEQNLSQTGYIDQTTAVSIGKIIGPSALVTLRVLRCEIEQDDRLYDYENVKGKDGNLYKRKVYISRTQAFLKASVQVTDLTTGKIFAATTLEYSPKRDNKSFDGRPVLPSKYEVQDTAFNRLRKAIHKRFFYWKEPVTLIYYDDKKCNLKDAYQLLKTGNIEGAYTKSKENLEFCKASGEKDKFKAHAFYNMGMSYFIKGDYDLAIQALERSKQIKKNYNADEAIQKCRKAKNLLAKSQRVEQRAQLNQQALANEQATKKATVQKLTLKNADIISFTKSKLPESLIIKKIQTSPCQFDTSTDELIKLVNSGISETVIAAMMEK